MKSIEETLAEIDRMIAEQDRRLAKWEAKVVASSDDLEKRREYEASYNLNAGSRAAMRALKQWIKGE